MRNVTTHHDGLGLNDLIDVEMSDEDANGVPHRVDFYRRLTPEEAATPNQGQYDVQIAGVERIHVGFFQMQHGPRNGEGSRPGLITDAIFAALIDILGGFQAGPFKSREGALVLTNLEQAALWSNKRAKDRSARGVLGHNKA